MIICPTKLHVWVKKCGSSTINHLVRRFQSHSPLCRNETIRRTQDKCLQRSNERENISKKKIWTKSFKRKYWENVSIWNLKANGTTGILRNYSCTLTNASGLFAWPDSSLLASPLCCPDEVITAVTRKTDTGSVTCATPLASSIFDCSHLNISPFEWCSKCWTSSLVIPICVPFMCCFARFVC